MKRMTGMLMCASALAAVLAAPAAPARGAETKEKPLVQLAILLDTSGSMQGLIEQAKTQLWKVVNEFLAADRDGVRPELQVALYEYGKSSIPRAEGYLRMICPLTTDLDKVSEELFALRTNGGQEYCGAVIQAATGGLQWSKSHRDMKTIFIAGNEPFTQGGVDYRAACRAAIGKGIVVNTIFCGSNAEGLKTSWADGAKIADGKYMCIDHNRAVVHYNAPQDKEIARLGAELNKTYVAYGREGEKAAARQHEQDANARKAAPGAMAQRAVTKSSANYRNTGWDLVDAVKGGKVKLEEVAEAELPAEMQKMDEAERAEYVKKQAADRGRLQKRIQELNAERKKYVAAKQREAAAGGADTLDGVMSRAIQEQAKAKGFNLK